MSRQAGAIAANINDASPVLDRTVESLEGIGPKRAALLNNLGIATFRDLLFHLPRSYQDRRSLVPISDLKKGDRATIEAEIVSARAVRMRGRMNMAVAEVRDATGDIKVTWFGRGFLARSLTPGTRVVLTGEVGTYKGLALKNPEYEILSGDDDDLLNTGCIVPIYRLTEGVTQRMLRRWVRTALDASAGQVEETLPEAMLNRYDFPSVAQTIEQIHFPDDLDVTEKARERFAYEELLALQLGVLQSRAARIHDTAGIEHKTDGPILGACRAALPFELTGAQGTVIEDILKDLRAPTPMARLIQGDVGSGKTVVALHAVAAAADGGYQSVVMAPTEVLAAQHFATFRDALEPLGLEVAFLTGSSADPAEVRRRAASGDTHVIVGTHALFQEKTQFHRLGLAIVDEQHRFGVGQRERLIEKGTHPDVLHMTATPIPRTIAMTLYGGMDISIIDELPPGRKPIKTRRIPPEKEDDLYTYLIEQAQQGFQTYVICPLVEDSETRALKSVTGHYEELAHGALAGVCTALLHGRVNAEEKTEILRAFQTGDIDVLFSTTVVEVGIDAPSATTMVIEDAAHFGLTQLHQLRGRVGRSDAQSYCFLMGEAETDEGRARLDIMCRTNDGFEIAEEDLALRGPGELQGLRQTGLSDLKAADLIRDVKLIEKARRDAETILDEDAELTSPQYAGLAARAASFKGISL